MLKGHGACFGLGPAGQNELTFFTVVTNSCGRGTGTCSVDEYHPNSCCKPEEMTHLEHREWDENGRASCSKEFALRWQFRDHVCQILRIAIGSIHYDWRAQCRVLDHFNTDNVPCKWDTIHTEELELKPRRC
jgi:hypothetical protein